MFLIWSNLSVIGKCSILQTLLLIIKNKRNAVISTVLLFLLNAADRNRTGTRGKSRRILSPVRLPVPPLRHTRQIAPTPLESCASMRSIASHYVITLLANHDNLLSRNGTNRARTYDPLLVRQMLSQLSYDPITTQKRLELSTSAVTGRRSNQLSHWAKY